MPIAHSRNGALIGLLAMSMLLDVSPLGATDAATAQPTPEPTTEGIAAGEISWRAVLFDGLKAGWASSQRIVNDEGVLTREQMVLEIQRAGTQVRLESLEESLEAPDGTALRFVAEQKVSDQRVRYEGERRSDGRFDVQSEVGGERSNRVLELPSDALFFEGQRQAIVDSGMAPGTVIEFQAFQPLMLDTVRVRTEVHGAVPTEVLTEDKELIEIVQEIYYSDRPLQIHAAVDASFEPQRISMNLQGMQIEMVSCDRECAMAPSQSPEFLSQLLITAPGKPRPDRATRYQITGAALDELPQTGHQRQRDGWLEVDPRVQVLPAEAPAVLERALEPTLWLQSDHTEIRQLAIRALGNPEDPALSRMRAAEDFVRTYVSGKTLSVGYASALEVSRNRRGDCTEHALLLAALGRAEGIPTRVLTGFARVSQFAGQADVFVPHAWTEAYVDGAWHGFDAALNGFGSGHIALAVGDGDPTRFYATLELLTSLQVIAAEAIEAGR